MDIKTKITEFKESHPTATKVIKTVAITGVTVGAFVGVGTVMTYITKNGVRIEVSTFESREAQFKMDGDARELFNAALGIEAKGLDASKTLERYNSVRDAYDGKPNAA